MASVNIVVPLISVIKTPNFVQPVINVIRAWTCKLKLRFQLLIQQVVTFTNSVIGEISKSGHFLKLARKELSDIAIEPLRYFLKEIKIWLIQTRLEKLSLTVFIASWIHWSLSIIDLSFRYLSLYPAVCRRKTKSVHITEAAQTRDNPHILNHSTFIFVFFL